MRLLKMAVFVLVALIALGLIMLIFLPALISFYWYAIP